MPRNKGSLNKHHKEKPKKEKKQRGRPKGSIKQKQNQKQKQVVNVTVNNGDGGGGGGKRKQPSIPQLPLNIFDPSLIMPNYGINTRQPVNPPDPENIDMTELITRLTAQYQPTQPISNADVSNVRPQNIKVNEKVEPITISEPPIKIKEPPIKIKADDVQPIVQNEDESNRMIEKKKKLEELKNKKILEVAEEILPKDKKPKMKNPKITKPKYKDTEGLGMKIPLGRVAEIGGAFLGGAAVGATTLATEAALVGAGTAIEEGSLLAGLNSVKDTMTARALASASLGGGVGSSVNTALGGGPVANIIASVAGGVASRNALKRYDKRQAAQKQKIV